MRARALSDTVFAMGQPTAEDFEEFAAAGVTALICNRVEDEEAGQPSTAAMHELARGAGLAFHHVPLAGPPTTEAVQAMAAALAGTDGPVVAYCKTGYRSAMLWSLAGCADGWLEPAEAVAGAATAGYDISRLANVLEALAESRNS